MPILIVFFVLLALFFRFAGPLPLSVNSIVTNKNDVFTAAGEGKVPATPDIATLALGIISTSANAKDAQNQANQTINKITDDLKKQGIETKDIKTTGYNLNPTYDFSSGRQKITGYQVSINLEVKVRDFEKINSVIDTATADGANLVGGLQFSVNEEKLKELQQEAREQAVKEAKQKAESLAKAAGIRLGRIVNIQENLAEPRPIPLALGQVVKEETSTKIEPGEQEIKINVVLSYETH